MKLICNVIQLTCWSTAFYVAEILMKRKPAVKVKGSSWHAAQKPSLKANLQSINSHL